MTAVIIVLYFITLALLGVFSYGFTDPHLILSGNSLYSQLHAPLFLLVNGDRQVTTVLFTSVLLVLFACYIWFLKNRTSVFPNWKKLFIVSIISALLLVLSYPALTYDLFNYIATAKVAFHYRENPYLVMPIEIPNEPNLAFTRAANKVALYGPVWILLTAFPHYLGTGNVWLTFIAFKAMNALVYMGFLYFIYRLTRNLTNVLFFAFNPLVLIEVIMNGHNDIYMIFLALAGLLLWQAGKLSGLLLFIASWFIKGATLILSPFLVIRTSWERLLVVSYWLLAGVFFIAAPLREELYPWYAVWLVAPAALLPYKNHRFIWQFTIILSLALELRNLPYMWMGYYESPGPWLRTIVTVVPVGIYLGWYFLKRRTRKV